MVIFLNNEKYISISFNDGRREYYSTKFFKIIGCYADFYTNSSRSCIHCDIRDNITNVVISIECDVIMFSNYYNHEELCSVYDYDRF